MKKHKMTYRRKLSDIAGRAESGTVLSGTALTVVKAERCPGYCCPDDSAESEYSFYFVFCIFPTG